MVHRLKHSYVARGSGCSQCRCSRSVTAERGSARARSPRATHRVLLFRPEALNGRTTGQGGYRAARHQFVARCKHASLLRAYRAGLVVDQTLGSMDTGGLFEPQRGDDVDIN